LPNKTSNIKVRNKRERNIRLVFAQIIQALKTYICDYHQNTFKKILSMELKTDLYLGDNRKILKELPDNSVDLIITSPPYADQRKSTYGGIHPDKYVEWFLPISEQLLRVLKPTGTFVLNIKEKVLEGERSTYVMELILEMRKQGWLWTEEFIWHKKNSYPGKWPNRFRDAWERLLQFNKHKKFHMYQEEVMVPMGDWAKSRLKNLSETDKKRDDSKVGSGFGKNISNWLDRDKAYPSNVLHLATECSNKSHSAAFPEELPEWFIKLFTKEQDTVLDPFMGSGTTNIVAQRMRRNSIGIEIVPEYYEIVKEKIEPVKLYLLEPKAEYENPKPVRRIAVR
jgi:site-specific DNA-methyltransferase (adenine-specific)/site-specific DNA-methyltransferase (cytosine-N4-specific)